MAAVNSIKDPSRDCEFGKSTFHVSNECINELHENCNLTAECKVTDGPGCGTVKCLCDCHFIER